MPNYKRQLSDAYDEIRRLKNAAAEIEFPLRRRIEELERDLRKAQHHATVLKADLRAIQLHAEYVAARAREAAGELARTDSFSTGKATL